MTQRVALVTGAMGGLGTAICQSLARDGFKVVANCLPNFEMKESWLAAQRDVGFDFAAAEGDVADQIAPAVRKPGPRHRAPPFFQVRCAM